MAADIKEHSLEEFRFRANLPRFFRYAAAGLIIVTIIAVIIGFYRSRANTQFRLKSEHTQLSTEIVAEISGYERLESDGEKAKYFLKADHAKTFSDNHQELENVFIRTYDDQGAEADKMTAQKVLYIPEENKNFTAYMNGDVNIDTRDGLNIKTNNIIYTKKNDTAEADEAVDFARGNVRGKSFGATVLMGEKRLELLKDVHIQTYDSPELAKSAVKYSDVSAGSASYDQATDRIELKTKVAISLKSKNASGGDRSTDIKADRAMLYLDGDVAGQDNQSAQLKRFELFDNVNIVSKDAGAQPTVIDSGYALYDKTADRYELTNGAHIVANQNDKPTDIKASAAIWDRPHHKIDLSGNAEVTQGGDYVKGDNVSVDLFPDDKVKAAAVRGNGLVRQESDTRTTTVTAPEINATWNDARQLAAANTVGESVARLEPVGDSEYSLITLSAPRAIRLVFKGLGLLTSMTTDGRTTIQFDAAGKDPNSASKRVTADTVNTYFYDNGKDMRRAEAVGDAELYIEPVTAAPENFKTTINAPRFDCDFFPTGSNAKTCVGGKKTKTVRVRTVAAEGRGTQTLLADTLNVDFNEKTRDLDRLDAVGNAKFTELQRSALSSQMIFTQADSTVRLRGGEPVAFDGSSRAKAKEIDWNTNARHSYLRGAVSVTYYSRKDMGDSVPFASSDKPVFITSETADFDHASSIATFTENARTWQGSNYVRGNRIVVEQDKGKMMADGNVQSVLYDSKQKVGARDVSVPVYAAAKSLNYDRDSRVLKYNGDTDIRQGTDRVTSGTTDVYLNENNEVVKTVSETAVVVTQPGRRASGSWLLYTAGDEVAVLRGSPAKVTDAENGSSEAAEITFRMREHNVISEGKAKPNSGGRLRNVYKIKPAQ